MYLTFDKVKKVTKPNEHSFEDFLLGLLAIPDLEVISEEEGEPKRITISKPKEELRNFFNNHKKANWLYIPEPPDWAIEDIPNHYTSFKIPKKTGGLRDIDAPDDELKDYLTHLKNYFEHTLKILTHDAAHAYVKNRSTITDLKVHQANDSFWFLKIDLHGFFPSHNIEYTLKMMEEIYPLGFLLEDEVYKAKLTRALSYAFLNNKLPQGTPLSPTLTNILMMPIDYSIQHKLWDMKSKFIYTRYADDMTISSPYKFKWLDVKSEITNILENFNTPFVINAEKTRFGSRNGRNWNLGLMLNKDNRITIGHKQNQRFRAMLFNIMQDYTHDIKWSLEDRQILGGQVSYYKAVDPVYTKAVIKRYEDKFGVRLKDVLKTQ